MTMGARMSLEQCGGGWVASEFIGTGIGVPTRCPLYGRRIPGESLAVTEGNGHKNRISPQNGQKNVRSGSCDALIGDHFVSEPRMSWILPPAARGSRVCWRPPNKCPRERGWRRRVRVSVHFGFKVSPHVGVDRAYRFCRSSGSLPRIGNSLTMILRAAMVACLVGV